MVIKNDEILCRSYLQYMFGSWLSLNVLQILGFVTGQQAVKRCSPSSISILLCISDFLFRSCDLCMKMGQSLTRDFHTHETRSSLNLKFISSSLVFKSLLGICKFSVRSVYDLIIY